MFGSTVAIPLMVTPAMCIGDDNVAKSEIIGTTFFVSGLVTILQATFGVRYEPPSCISSIKCTIYWECQQVAALEVAQIDCVNKMHIKLRNKRWETNWFGK